MSRQKKVNIIGAIIATMAFIVLGVTYSLGMHTAIYVLPFTLALCGLGLWNRSRWKAEKEARRASRHHS